MDTLKNNHYRALLEGYLSIYDLSPSIHNPYEDEEGNRKSAAQSIYEHWWATGEYLQWAMSSFNEQETQKTRSQ